MEMTKLKQFSTSLMSFIQHNTTDGLGEDSASPGVECASQGIWSMN